MGFTPQRSFAALRPRLFKRGLTLPRAIQKPIKKEPCALTEKKLAEDLNWLLLRHISNKRKEEAEITITTNVRMWRNRLLASGDKTLAEVIPSLDYSETEIRRNVRLKHVSVQDDYYTTLSGHVVSDDLWATFIFTRNN